MDAARQQIVIFGLTKKILLQRVIVTMFVTDV